MSKKPLLNHGQRIKVGSDTFVVTTLSQNDDKNYPINFTYELIELSELEAKVKSDEKAAADAKLEAEKRVAEEAKQAKSQG